MLLHRSALQRRFWLEANSRFPAPCFRIRSVTLQVATNGSYRIDAGDGGGRRFPLKPSENKHFSNRDRMIDCVEVVFGSMTVARD